MISVVLQAQKRWDNNNSNLENLLIYETGLYCEHDGKVSWLGIPDESKPRFFRLFLFRFKVYPWLGQVYHDKLDDTSIHSRDFVYSTWNEAIESLIKGKKIYYINYLV